MRGVLQSLAVLVAALTLVPSAHAAEPTQGPYGKAGRWITDRSGRTVVLNGWNIVNKIAPYTPEAIGFDDDDVAFLRRHGFDTIRLGIIWKGLEPRPGRYDERYLASIERTYDLLARNGFAVLLDFHQDMYNERFQGEGMPDWAVLADAALLPAVPRAGFPANYVVMPALQRAYDAFWTNRPGPDGRPIWDAYADAWVHVAERFRDKPRLLGYNLFNEPFPGTRAVSCVITPKGCPDFDLKALDAFNAAVTHRIRAVDRRAIVWYAPWLTFDYGVASAHRKLDDRAGFAFNAYCQNSGGATGGAVALLFPYYATKTCEQLADIQYANGDGVAARNDEAVLNTEFGATDDLPLLRTYLEALERRMIGWQQWSYWNTDPCCERPIEGIIRDPRRPPADDNVKPHKLELSARPHPAAISGTPTGWRFDLAGKRFELSYTTLRPGSATRRFVSDSLSIITVPRLHYPAGYRVAVTGARVVSKPGGVRLKLRSCRGARRVTVTVTTGRATSAANRCRRGARSARG